MSDMLRDLAVANKREVRASLPWLMCCVLEWISTGRGVQESVRARADALHHDVARLERELSAAKQVP